DASALNVPRSCSRRAILSSAATGSAGRLRVRVVSLAVGGLTFGLDGVWAPLGGANSGGLTASNGSLCGVTKLVCSAPGHHHARPPPRRATPNITANNVLAFIRTALQPNLNSTMINCKDQCVTQSSSSARK